MHTQHRAINTADSADLPESQSAFLLLSIAPIQQSQFPALTPLSNRVKTNLAPSIQPFLIYSTHRGSYLFDFSTFCPHEDQRVVLVDIGNDRCHFVNGVRKERLATHHLRHTQRCVHVEAAKVIING